jgi:hypothetical protein
LHAGSGEEVAMSSRIIERPRPQHDREPRPDDRGPAEPRKSYDHPVEIVTPEPGSHTGFDADLNPIDDDFINTHGSER